MSLFDRLRDRDDDAETDQPAADGGSNAANDPFDAEFDADDGLGDEGLDDLSMMDEDDEYATEELERRIDEVETELASLSSTVNTIRSENEEISDTVGEVEENVRKLLDVYEMVTRGINPFTDDVDTGNAGAVGGGTFGLFDDEDEEPDDDLDEEVAPADADSFFGDEESDLDDSNDIETEETTDDGGATFDDLKAEYDAGDAEWDEEDDPDSDSTDAEAGVSMETVEEADAELEYAERTLSDAPDAEKPYLRGSTDGYVADLLVLEWLEYLVDAAGPTAATEAIEYYESIGWIDDEAGDQLRAFMAGFDAEDADERLTIAHHTQSLRYVCRLSSSNAAPVGLLGWNGGARRLRR